MPQRWAVSVVFLVCFIGYVGASSAPSGGPNGASYKLPLTTSSKSARQHFEKAMQNLEYVRRDDALSELRQATLSDPHFVQAWILISHLSPDPEEQRSTLLRAEESTGRVSPGERLLVTWLAGVQEDRFVPAIAAMNDLLARYPEDQRLAFLAGRWLIFQERYEQAVVVLERAVTLAPNYPAACNELAYAYAYSGDFEKAFAVMDRYVALQPDQPNPHDSYGELLQLAGKFDAALEQYRISIRIDPNFGSELGVADTYALMGKQEEAREEYARAIVFATSESDKVEYELQSAVTWIREGNHKQAEKALREVARHAHASGLGRLEAEAQRVWALSDPDYKQAMKHAQAAVDSLTEGHAMSRADRDEEHARILLARAFRSAEAHDWDLSSASVKQLETMATASRSQVVQRSYHGAAGALLVAQAKYADAIPHLEEDVANPLSMRLLWQSYDHTGATAQATALAAKLSVLEIPTAEQALVVPQFRAGLISQAGRP
jgi:tetratricopeptide (TPR) repeat protein